jgi:hypothetical protein
MARKRAPSALKSLRPDESCAVLDALLKAHPDLVVEAERLAASILDDTTWESVAEDVEYALRSLPLEALSDRAGYHPSEAHRVAVPGPCYVYGLARREVVAPCPVTQQP